MSSDEVSEPDIWKWEHLTQDLVREAIMRDSLGRYQRGDRHLSRYQGDNAEKLSNKPEPANLRAPDVLRAMAASVEPTPERKKPVERQKKDLPP